MASDAERDQGRFRLGIRGRIAIWFVIGALALMALGGYVIYSSGLSLVQNTLGKTYCQIAGRVSEQYQSGVMTRYELVRGIATDVLTTAVATEATQLYNKKTQDWIETRRARLADEWTSAKPEGRQKALHRHLSDRLMILSRLEADPPKSLSVFDTQGILLGTSSAPEQRLAGGEKWFASASQASNHFTYIEFERVPDSIIIVLPVWGGVEIVGYVMGEFDFSTLVHGIVDMQFGETGEAMVVDYAGAPLMGAPEKHLIDIMKQSAPRALDNTAKDSAYWVTLPEKGASALSKRLACIAPVARINTLREVFDLPPWNVVVTQSPEESYAALERSIKEAGLVGIVGVLLIGLVGGISATNLTRPLLSLRNGMRQFTQGNHEQRVNVNSADEIGDLTAEFNRMADRVVTTENELRAFAQAVEDATDAIILTNSDAIIYYANPAFEMVTGYSVEEVCGQRPSIVRSHKTPKATHEAMWAALAQGKAWRGEVWNQRKNGDIYPADLTISPIHDENGDTVSLLGIQRDITLTRELQSKLEREVAIRTREIAATQGLAAMGRMASMIAHDLRNALSTVKMNLQILYRQRKGETDDAVEMEHFNIAIGQVHYMEEFLADMLAYARPGELQTERHDLLELVNEVIAAEAAMAEECDIGLHLKAGDGLPKVRVDRMKIAAVLRNLIDNAIQAMPDGGDVTIELARDDDGMQVEISVTDTGPGIPDDMVDQVLEPFFTNRTKGTGLGLAIVKRIIEQHDGQIVVGAASGGGAKITMSLPTGEAPG